MPNKESAWEGWRVEPHQKETHQHSTSEWFFSGLLLFTVTALAFVVLLEKHIQQYSRHKQNTRLTHYTSEPKHFSKPHPILQVCK